MQLQILGLPVATSIFLTGFAISGLTVYLARMNDKDDFQVKEGLTLSGIITGATLLYIDFLKYTGEVPVQISNQLVAWLNDGLIEVAGLTKFFAVLVIAWTLLDYQFPGKMEFFNKVTG